MSSKHRKPASPEVIFAALGDRIRLNLVSRLSGGGPMSITALASGENVTRQAVTKHLRVMEAAGLVRGRRHGRERIWQLEARRLEDARKYLKEISHQWDNALARLQAYVERPER